MPYRLVILDFDGTLADSADWFAGVLNGVAREFGFRTVADDEFAVLHRQDNRAILRHLGIPAWKLPLIARRMRQLAERDRAAIGLFPGADAMVRALESRGVALAIVSSNAEEHVRGVLGDDLARRFDVIEGGASLFGKAARIGRVLRRTGIPAGEAIAIGDEVRDIEAAAAAGVAAGAVAWGYADPDLLRARRPAYLFTRMADIPPAVAG
jgi:phosphoglycolate phosphatase